MPRSKYAVLAQQLRDDIQNGVYLSGQRLPSENELVTATGYSRQTVRQAMEVLEHEGLTDRVRGSGTFVRSNVPQRERTRNIAVLTTYIGEYIFPNILHGIDHVLAKNGYTSLLAATRNRVDNERKMLKELLEKPIDGMIVEGTKTALPNPNIDLYKQFVQRGIPLVFFNGFYPELKDYVHVVMDDRAGGQMACEALIKAGHKQIAGFFKNDDIQGHRRYAGYAETLLNAGLPIIDDHVMWFTTEEKGRLPMDSIKQILSDCTAAVCYNDEIALQIIQGMGESIENIQLASLDHSTIAKLAAVPYLSLCHPSDKLGRLAAEKLLHLLDGQTETSLILPWSIEE